MQASGERSRVLHNYIGERGCVLCQFIEPVTFECCTFIFALQNIAFGGHLDTCV